MRSTIKPGHFLKEFDPKDAWRAHSKSKYIWAMILCYLLLALIVFLYLKQQPIFSSNFSLVLPGTGHSSNFNLDDVGQANSQTKSAYGGSGFSPRVNYKEILRSKEVVNQAAFLVGIDGKQFKVPKVKLIQQTSIIEIDVLGETSEYAQSKAAALYDAFQDRLSQLRQDETQRHYESVAEVLDHYRIRLARARQGVIEFQERSLLVSRDQWEQLTSQLTDLQQKQMYVAADAKSKEDYVRQLSLDLRISPSLAGQAFALQSDTLFQSYMRELDTSGSRLSEYRSRWGEKHPKVQSEQGRFQKAKNMLMQRSVNIVGQQSAEALYEMSLQISPHRAQLFSDLVENFATLQGKLAEISELAQAEHKLDSTLKIYAREMVELERLEREVQLAEAVYTSAAAKLDASKSDIFASYPIVQLLSPPSYPRKQKSPKLILAIVIGLGGFIIITIGFLVIWQRDYLIKRLLKKS